MDLLKYSSKQSIIFTYIIYLIRCDFTYVGIFNLYLLQHSIAIIQCQCLMLVKDKNQLISHYNDLEENHTYYLINIQKCYQNAICLDYSLTDNKVNRCKYCKAFPFNVNKVNKTKKQINNKQLQVNYAKQSITKTTKQKQKLQSSNKNIMQCQLCQSLNQKQLNLIDAMQQSQQHEIRPGKGFITSYLINYESNLNKIQTKNLNNMKEKNFNYQIRFVYFIDLSVSISILEHFKNVSLQIYQGFISQQLQTASEDNTQNQQKFKQIVILLLIDSKLYLVSFQSDNFETICLQSLISDKQPFTQLLQTSVLECNSQNLKKFEQFFGILIQMKQEGRYTGYSLDGGKYFYQILKTLKNDSSPLNYYVPIWIGKIPPVHYTSHQIVSKNIHTVLFLFNQPVRKNAKKHSNSIQEDDMDLFNISIKNQMQMISDNQEVYFLQDNQQNHEFYYKFYQIFRIYSTQKLFNSKIQIKADSKYFPKIITYHHNLFNLKSNHHVLIRSDNKTNNKKFQISIQFDDQNQKKKLFLINWTSQDLKLMDKFVHIYACIQNSVKYIFTQALAVKKIEPSHKNRHIQKTVDTNRLTVLLNDYMYMFNKNEITHDIYQFFVNNKRRSFSILNFLSDYESVLSVYRLYPIINSKMIYWVDAFTVNNIFGESNEFKNHDNNGQELDELIQVLNDYCEIYYSKQARNMPIWYEIACKQGGKCFMLERLDSDHDYDQDENYSNYNNQNDEDQMDT